MFLLQRFSKSIFDDFPMIHSITNMMNTNIKSNKKEYILEIDLPGLNKKDISVEVKNNHLIISAEYNIENKDDYVLLERRNGQYKRSFYIGDIDKKDIKAKYDNGVLTVKVPKKDNTEYLIDIE